MSKILIRVGSLPHEHPSREIFIEAADVVVYGIEHKEVDHENSELQDYIFFEVEERDVDFILEELTMNHPNKEIRAYREYRSGIRPAGDIIYKEVSEKGSLPA